MVVCLTENAQTLFALQFIVHFKMISNIITYNVNYSIYKDHKWMLPYDPKSLPYTFTH